MTKAEVIKTYFGTDEKPVTNTELLQLRREDKEGFDWLANEAAKELEVTIDQPA